MKVDRKTITVVSSGDFTLQDVSTGGFMIEKKSVTPKTIAVRHEHQDRNDLYQINKKLGGDRAFLSKAQTKGRTSDQGTE